ncbi:MbtH family protein [Dickeya chrysanthemi]|uniref:MbtH family protein n=1 Tax=Dickeya chrysanthemi TaxID=556 RepID=UPI001CF5B808|nr:MbtH family NRPS accessory protein [Dickeya chrysanthemi]MCA7006958.1 MbtH family NRPS accessory protein [Dickeya chrysanthemi]
MSSEIQPLAKEFLTVVNSEGQYSIWPALKELPAGWADAGKRGTREECLEYISHIWTDMRPISLREKSSLSNETVTDTLKV